MFEFEMHGGMDALIDLEDELCYDLGFPQRNHMEKEPVKRTKHSYPQMEYLDVAKMYRTTELEHEHETKLAEEYGPVFFITDFPEYTSPFWNMARNTDGTSKKVDVIINGQETIGSAERSCDKEEMKHQFYTISEGAYAKTLFSGFTKERVEGELKEFLEFDFFPRSGAGMGVTRMIRALEENDLLD
jgi:aspartyl/asparaginyl-tRNA synthetase